MPYGDVSPRAPSRSCVSERDHRLEVDRCCLLAAPYARGVSAAPLGVGELPSSVASHPSDQFDETCVAILLRLLSGEGSRDDLGPGAPNESRVSYFDPRRMMAVPVISALAGACALVTLSIAATPVALLSRAVVHLDLNPAIANRDCFRDVSEVCASELPVPMPAWGAFGGRNPGRPDSGARRSLEHLAIGRFVTPRGS